MGFFFGHRQRGGVVNAIDLKSISERSAGSNPVVVVSPHVIACGPFYVLSYRDIDYIHSIGKGKYYYNKKTGETTFKRPEGLIIEDSYWWRSICKNYEESKESESDDESEESDDFEESESNDSSFENYYSILRRS